MNPLVISVIGLCVTILTCTVAIVFYIAKMATKVEFLGEAVEKLSERFDDMHGNVAELRTMVTVHASILEGLKGKYRGANERRD